LTPRKKTIRSSQSATERVQIYMCEYWEKVKTIDPDNLVFLDEMGVLWVEHEPMHVQDVVVESTT
jgi:hypothetical protein